jgi:hypothetical protein
MANAVAFTGSPASEEVRLPSHQYMCPTERLAGSSYERSDQPPDGSVCNRPKGASPVRYNAADMIRVAMATHARLEFISTVSSDAALSILATASDSSQRMGKGLGADGLPVLTGSAGVAGG